MCAGLGMGLGRLDLALRDRRTCKYGCVCVWELSGGQAKSQVSRDKFTSEGGFIWGGGPRGIVIPGLGGWGRFVGRLVGLDESPVGLLRLVGRDESPVGLGRLVGRDESPGGLGRLVGRDESPGGLGRLVGRDESPGGLGRLVGWDESPFGLGLPRG
eukprot:351370-Chlamydomonas_euryale.AAC.2